MPRSIIETIFQITFRISAAVFARFAAIAMLNDHNNWMVNLNYLIALVRRYSTTNLTIMPNQQQNRELRCRRQRYSSVYPPRKQCLLVLFHSVHVCILQIYLSTESMTRFTCDFTLQW